MTAPFRHTADDYGLTQPGRRTSYNVYDQHRRKWLVSVEPVRRGGMALVGAVIPCFDDPLRTPQKYVALAKGRVDQIVIDYEAWATDQAAATAEWTARRDEFGRDLYEDRYDADLAIDQLPGRGKELVRLIGPPPLSPETVRRAAAGDKTVLKGQQPDRPRRRRGAPTPAPED